MGTNYCKNKTGRRQANDPGRTRWEEDPETPTPVRSCTERRGHECVAQMGRRDRKATITEPDGPAAVIFYISRLPLEITSAIMRGVSHPGEIREAPPLCQPPHIGIPRPDRCTTPHVPRHTPRSHVNRYTSYAPHVNPLHATPPSLFRGGSHASCGHTCHTFHVMRVHAVPVSHATRHAPHSPQ